MNQIKRRIMSDHLVIVPGGLNTDILALGVDRILGEGELTLGGELQIGPGGKARNMAQMAAVHLGPGKVAMIGRSSADPFGLWKIPIDSLKNSGVDTTCVQVSDFNDCGGKFPGIALIPVDKQGKNQIYVLPGVNRDFSSRDIEEAELLFENSSQKKILVMALEIPLDVVEYCIEKAARNKIRVILDPGGITESIDGLLTPKIFLLKPNEFEAEIITGIKINDFESAGRAAQIILSRGVQNVFITHGSKGGYLFGENMEISLPVSQRISGQIRDETGCGDQVTATVAACLATGRDLLDAARLSIIAGTLQFYKAGIQPINKRELESNQG
jgi:ribokinase